MSPVHDSDVLLLQAITLSSKRKPANFDDIVLALNMVQTALLGAHDARTRMPTQTKLLAAFERLLTKGLIEMIDDGFSLSSDAQKIMASLPKKADAAESTFSLKEKLATFAPANVHAATALDPEQLAQAIERFLTSLPPPSKKPQFNDPEKLSKHGKPAARKWDYSRPGPRKAAKR